MKVHQGHLKEQSQTIKSMKTKTKVAQWLKKQCKTLSQVQRKRLLIALFIAYVLLTIWIIGKFIYKF